MAFTILVADDNRQLVAAYERLAQARGYRVIKCYDGAEALGLAIATVPDVIILDIMMPELDGRDVISRLKRDSATSQTPIIVSSAGSDDMRRVCIEYGVAEFLAKPVDFDELFRKIERLLSRRA